MSSALITFIVVLALFGFGTMTMMARGQTGAENARYAVAVVVIAALFGWVLSLVSGS